MKVKVTDLHAKVLDGVQKLGYEGPDGETISEVLLYAQLRGNNQGITKIATGGVPKAQDVEDGWTCGDFADMRDFRIVQVQQ